MASCLLLDGHGRRREASTKTDSPKYYYMPECLDPGFMYRLDDNFG